MTEKIEKKLSDAVSAIPSIDPVLQWIIDSTAASTSHLYREGLDDVPEIRSAKELLQELATWNASKSWFEEFDSCMKKHIETITLLKDNVDTELNLRNPGIKKWLEFERDWLWRAIILYIWEIFSSDERQLSDSEKENLPKILKKGFNWKYGERFQEEIKHLSLNDRFRWFLVGEVIK